jgi:hypothetical protein
MKANKLLTLTLSAVTATALLVGCGGKDDVTIEHSRAVGTTLFVSENGDLREAITNEIEMARTMNRNELERNSNASNHDVNRVAEITEFYFPSIEIEGFELHNAAIFDSTLIFTYAPLNTTRDVVSIVPTIRIFVGRPEWDRKQGGDIFHDTVRESVESGFGRLTESGMMYAEDGLIFARLGDTTLRIDVPAELNRYEFLRDIALQIIDTAELVDVEQELEVLRRNES